MTVPDDATAAVEAGDVALVTGSTGGIGREIARALAAAGATVLVHGRDREKGEQVVTGLPGDDHDFYRTDLSDLDAVREFATAVRDDYDRLDVLVNNAGTWQGDRHLVSVPGGDEVELTFVVNHLAPYLLTHLLVDPLAAAGEKRTADRTAGASDDGDTDTDDDTDADDDADTDAGAGARGPARVVTVSSGVHRRAEMDIEAVRGESGPSGIDAYGLSKLANVMFTYELARRLPEGVIANCCHPGIAPETDLARGGSFLSALGWRLYGLVGAVTGSTDSAAEAATTPTYLAGAPEVADANGDYFEDCERTRSSEASYDRSAQRELWRQSADWVGLTEDERDRLSA